MIDNRGSEFRIEDSNHTCGIRGRDIIEGIRTYVVRQYVRLAPTKEEEANSGGS